MKAKKTREYKCRTLGFEMEDGVTVPISFAGYVGFVVGFTLLCVGIGDVAASAYPTPTIPPRFFFGLVITLIGSSTILGSAVTYGLLMANRWVLVHQRKRDILVVFLITLWFGIFTTVFGIEKLARSPLERPPCACLPGHYGPGCTPCPTCNVTTSEGCHDGITGTGACLCSPGFSGRTCDTCAPTFTGADCNVCKRGWTGSTCDVCDIGYGGVNCDTCLSDWVTGSDDVGVLCRDCKPGRYGRMCTPCPDCTVHGDTLAICKDNDWFEKNEYVDRCTSTGVTCTTQDDCSSFNCKGECSDGSRCESDDDCIQGPCQYKTCCNEPRYSAGVCKCNRQGYYGPFCEKAPGFDGVNGNTICSAHGTPSVLYADGKYSHVRCVCDTDWSGSSCGCYSTGGTCSKCADGHYGSDCDICPGGVGVAQCSQHGVCADGVTGNGTCTCDLDLTSDIGGWRVGAGGSCTACYSDNFYGNKCSVCPQTEIVACGNGNNLTPFPGSGNCLDSCVGTAMTCNTSTGMCDVTI